MRLKKVLGCGIFCIMGIAGGMLTACNQVPENNMLSTEVSEGSMDQQQESTQQKEPQPESIAYTDWNIKNHPVEGTDNLYELDLETLSDSESWIVALKPYQEQVLILKEYESAGSFLYLVNLLNVEVSASIQLPDGSYSSDGIRVNEENKIEVTNLAGNEIYIYNEMLEEQERITPGEVNANRIFLAKDHQYLYYMDNTDGKFYQYDLQSRTAQPIFTDYSNENMSNGQILGLLKNDTCLLLNYVDTKSEETIYEVRNIYSDEVLYHDTAELSVVETGENAYIVRHEEEGLDEILYKSKDLAVPKVLSLKDYSEYEKVNISFNQQSVVSGMRAENAGDEYLKRLENEGNSDLPDLSGKTTTKLSLNQYSLETGKRQYSMDFYYIHDESVYISGCQGVYLENAECMLCFIEGSEKRFLVWDLTKESSKTEDETEYLYNWQNPKQPDTEGMEKLEQRAAEIGQKNGVEIHFGESVQECPKDIYDYQVSNNVIRIDKMLDLLEVALAKYPKGMLAQLETEESSLLHIYLAGKIVPTDEMAVDTSVGIQNTIDGITFLVLDINSFADLENTIYHEIFHAIENYLYWKNGDAFADWEELNPEGFDYDYDYQENAQNSSNDYTIGDKEYEVYFVDSYSKSFPNEDRARIMEYAMLKDERRHNIDAEKIQKKLKYICEQIRAGFNTEGWQEQTIWEEALQSGIFLN